MNRNPICKNLTRDHNISKSSRGFCLIATKYHFLPCALINQFRCITVLDTALIFCGGEQPAQIPTRVLLHVSTESWLVHSFGRFLLRAYCVLGPGGNSGRRADSEPGSRVVEPLDQRGMCNDRAKGHSTHTVRRRFGHGRGQRKQKPDRERESSEGNR